MIKFLKNFLKSWQRKTVELSEMTGWIAVI